MKLASKHFQGGVTLIESLVSMVILALGILGLIGFQLQTLRDTRDSVGRSRAIVATQDISERIRINPFGSASYVNVGFGVAAAAATDCTANSCSTAQLAAWDIARWKASLAQALPGGDGAVRQSGTDQRQYAVMVCWRENKGDDAAATAIVKDTTSSGSVAGLNLTCPNGLTGHLTYVQPFR